MLGESGHLLDVGQAQEEELTHPGPPVLPDGVHDLVVVAHQSDRGCSEIRDRAVQSVGVTQASCDSALPIIEVNVTESERAENSRWVLRARSATRASRSVMAARASSRDARATRDTSSPTALPASSTGWTRSARAAGASGNVSRQSACLTASWMRRGRGTADVDLRPGPPGGAERSVQPAPPQPDSTCPGTRPVSGCPRGARQMVRNSSVRSNRSS